MHKCNACRAKQGFIFIYRGFKYYKCISCSLVSTYPLPNREEIIKHYSKKFKKGNYSLLLENDKEYQRVYKGFISILNELKKQYQLNSKNPEALDIGCFTGTFLEMLKKRGYKVTGLELQKEAVEIAQKKLPNQVFQIDVMSRKMPNKKYDAIFMLGLIEHVTNPSLLVTRCSKLLKENGILFIQTPNSSSLPAKVLGKYWPPYSPVEHIHLFSKLSLTKLLEKNGFKIIYSGNHTKKLPFSYVFNMLDNFGPEYKNLLKPIYKFLPDKLKNVPLPFYIGEVVVVGNRLPQK